MKKIILSTLFLLMTTFAISAENISTVWDAIKDWGILNVENTTSSEASQNGFTTLSAGYIKSPHSSIVNDIEEALDVIDKSFLIGENANDQMSVKLYAQPAGSMYTVLVYSYYSMPHNHMLVIMYGTCTSSQLSAIKKLAGK